jgi:hypothetical protein
LDARPSYCTTAARWSHNLTWRGACAGWGPFFCVAFQARGLVATVAGRWRRGRSSRRCNRASCGRQPTCVCNPSACFPRIDKPGSNPGCAGAATVHCCAGAATVHFAPSCILHGCHQAPGSKVDRQAGARSSGTYGVRAARQSSSEPVSLCGFRGAWNSDGWWWLGPLVRRYQACTWSRRCPVRILLVNANKRRTVRTICVNGNGVKSSSRCSAARRRGRWRRGRSSRRCL